jgi:ABC-type polar amino acid transport system ATPase subunit
MGCLQNGKITLDKAKLREGNKKQTVRPKKKMYFVFQHLIIS